MIGDAGGTMGERPTRVRAMLRRLGFHRSELRRPVDRLQSAIGLGLLFTFLLLGPLVAARVVHHTYDSGAWAEQRQAATRHRTEATVVGRLDSVGAISGEIVRERARVQWQAADGSTHTGDAITGRPVGTHVLVWVDDTETITGPPQTRTQTIGGATFAAMGALLAVAVPLVACHLVIRRRLDRRRRNEWDAEWARVAARWTGLG
jgi:hypothetical protein